MQQSRMQSMRRISILLVACALLAALIACNAGQTARPTVTLSPIITPLQATATSVPAATTAAPPSPVPSSTATTGGGTTGGGTAPTATTKPVQNTPVPVTIQPTSAG